MPSTSSAKADQTQKSDGATQPKYAAPALDKGLDILELLSEAPTPLTLSQIAKALDRNSNEIFRMIVTLEQRGYLQVDESDRYYLTLKMFELAHRHQPIRSLVSTALPLMRECANRAKQSCHLTVYEGGRLIVVASVESPDRWVFGLKVGVLVGLSDTASGLVMLSFSNEIERARILAAHVKLEGEADMDPGQLERQIKATREQGYALMPSKQIRGVTNIAYPVFSSEGTARAVIQVPYIERVDNVVTPDIDEVSAVLQDVSACLSRLMGFSG
jgi:DNA-binding IclR family transcriptional regulator